jgi:hypothetical protein
MKILTDQLSYHKLPYHRAWLGMARQIAAGFWVVEA